MPSRKPRPPAQTSDERRHRAERVVHREEMRTNIGDVLASEHVDEAIGVLYLRDELGGGASSPRNVDAVGDAVGGGAHDARDAHDAHDAHDVRDAQGAHRDENGKNDAAWRHRIAAYSPARLRRASIAALLELSAAVQDAGATGG